MSLAILIIFPLRCLTTRAVSDVLRATEAVFGRITGDPVEADRLKTYAEALAQYHLSCEDEFSNGQFYDRGRTARRHVVATGIVLIGKEANQVGESGEAHPIGEAVKVFRVEDIGYSP